MLPRQNKPKQWSRLDNAAKLFASTVNKADAKVFRFGCELTQEVDPSCLQRALDRTVLSFPLYRCVMKKGLFWYYFEESNLRPVIAAETQRPCSALFDKNEKGLLFRVSFYKQRINLEVFHALSDGTGALEFLRLLVYNYLSDKLALERVPPLQYDASRSQRMDDSFAKYYRRQPRARSSHVRAHQLRGPRLAEHRLRILEGSFSTSATLRLAKEYGATIGVLFTAVLLCSINQELAVRDRRRPVVITVPVNLRKYFPSASARNFFNTIMVPYLFQSPQAPLRTVVASVSESFRRQLEAEQVERRMNAFGAIERNVFARATPLTLKDVFIRLGDRYANAACTAAFSNVGKVEMPDCFAPYIRLFNVCVSTNRLQLCLCSFGDRMTASFTSPLVSTDIQKNFFRFLTDHGIDVELCANPLDEDDAFSAT